MGRSTAVSRWDNDHMELAVQAREGAALLTELAARRRALIGELERVELASVKALSAHAACVRQVSMVGPMQVSA